MGILFFALSDGESTHNLDGASILSGIRVLDLSTIVAGPAASMILSDLGAEVIKVEPARGGEPARQMGPHRGEFGAYFTVLNRGKRSIGIDLSKPEGREIVLRLASSCDVFLENFRGGKGAAMGLDEPSIRARRPEVIYASLSAYGATGPDYPRTGYDAVLQGRTGIMSVTGAGENSAPTRSGVSILDLGTGVWMALGILAALLGRQRTGKGQRVDTSLFQTGVMLMSYHLLYRQFAGVNPKPEGSRHTAFAPYGAFQCADGSIMIGVSSDKAFHRLCEAFERPELAGDPRFRTNADRVCNVEALEQLVCEVLQAKPVSHWSAVLDRHDVANDPLQNAEQVIADRQVEALGQLAEIALGGQTPALVPRLPIGLSRNPPVIQGPPPGPGEHTGQVLREAGYADGEIQHFLRSGVCG
jgi:crotonobetainyl-CoA:carnitine CoA-transferase CaiB-like acyl-CoA transferase